MHVHFVFTYDLIPDKKTLVNAKTSQKLLNWDLRTNFYSVLNSLVLIPTDGSKHCQTTQILIDSHWISSLGTNTGGSVHWNMTATVHA